MSRLSFLLTDKDFERDRNREKLLLRGLLSHSSHFSVSVVFLIDKQDLRARRKVTDTSGSGETRLARLICLSWLNSRVLALDSP